MATVDLSFSPLPAHVRTARLVATSLARLAGVEEGLLDEVRLAVGEACSRAVDLHARDGSGTPVQVELRDESDSFTVVVRDRVGDPDEELDEASGLDPIALAEPDAEPGPLPSGFGLAVITGLVDDSTVERSAAGTSVTMRWKATARADADSSAGVS